MTNPANELWLLLTGPWERFQQWRERRRPVEAVEQRGRHDWEDWPEWWAFPPKDREAWVIAMRHGWERKIILRPMDCSPAMNVAGLHWKPWRGETVEHIPLQAILAESGK